MNADHRIKASSKSRGALMDGARKAADRMVVLGSEAQVEKLRSITFP